jgi:hypothetical protein
MINIMEFGSLRAQLNTPCYSGMSGLLAHDGSFRLSVAARSSVDGPPKVERHVHLLDETERLTGSF